MIKVSNRGNCLLASASAAVLLLALQSAQAQESPGEGAQEDSVFSLDKVVVTATRRDEFIDTIPVSVTAVTSRQLEALGAEDVTDVELITPNFNATSVATRPNDPILAIRGLLKRDGDATIDTAVGVYADDVFLARGYSVMGQLLDVERIEVLRGPQGTLFGRNTIGGAVQVISKKAEIGTGRDGYLEATIGNYAAAKVAGASTLQVADNMAIRVAGKFNRRDGYTKAALVDDTGPAGYHEGDPIIDIIDTNNAEDWSLRGSFAWEPDAQTRIDLSAYFSESDTNGVLSRGLRGDLATLSPTFFQSPTPCAPGGCGLSVGFSNFADDDFYKGLTDIRPNGDSAVQIYTSKIEHDFSLFSAKFIASHAAAESSSALNLDGAVGFGTPLVVSGVPLPPTLLGREVQSYSDGETSQSTFELQFTGEIGTAIDWIGGIYYFTESSDDLAYIARSNIVGSGVPFSVADVTADNNSQSIYGSVSFDVLPDVKLRVGGRYTEDEKGFVGRSRTYNPATGLGVCAFDPTITFPTGLEPGSYVDPSCLLENSQDFENLTWDVSLDYQVTDDVFAYAKVGTGYRSGGISLNANSPLTAVPFKEDKVTSYEVGAKADLSTFAHINAALFYTDYTDVQQNISSAEIPALGIDCATGYTGAPVVLSCNVGEANTKGVEIDAVVNVSDSLSLLGTYGYTKFEYDNPAYIPLFVPEQSFSVSASYETTVAQRPLNAILSYQSSDGFYGGLTNNGVDQEYARIDGYSLLNARLNLDLTDSLTVSLWGRNLTGDEYYGSSITLTAPIVQVNAGIPATPRTYGVDLRLTF